jgi:hypothetical protein
MFVLRQREEWIRFSYSNEDTKDEERRKGWFVDRRLNVVPSAKPVEGFPAPCTSLGNAAILHTKSRTSNFSSNAGNTVITLKINTHKEIVI